MKCTDLFCASMLALLSGFWSARAPWRLSWRLAVKACRASLRRLAGPHGQQYSLVVVRACKGDLRKAPGSRKTLGRKTRTACPVRPPATCPVEGSRHRSRWRTPGTHGLGRLYRKTPRIPISAHASDLVAPQFWLPVSHPARANCLACYLRPPRTDCDPRAQLSRCRQLSETSPRLGRGRKTSLAQWNPAMGATA